MRGLVEMVERATETSLQYAKKQTEYWQAYKDLVEKTERKGNRERKNANNQIEKLNITGAKRTNEEIQATGGLWYKKSGQESE